MCREVRKRVHSCLAGGFDSLGAWEGPKFLQRVQQEQGRALSNLPFYDWLWWHHDPFHIRKPTSSSLGPIEMIKHCTIGVPEPNESSNPDIPHPVWPQLQMPGHPSGNCFCGNKLHVPSNQLTQEPCKLCKSRGHTHHVTYNKPCSNRAIAREASGKPPDGDQCSACLGKGKGPRCQGSFRHTRALQLQVCETPAAWGIQDLTNSLLVFNSLVPSDNEFNVSSYLSVSFWVIALIEVRNPENIN